MTPYFGKSMILGLTCTFALAGCGSNSSSQEDGTENQQNLTGQMASVMPEYREIDGPSNLIDCSSAMTSGSCQFKNGAGQTEEEMLNGPGLITFRYTLKCLGQSSGSLSNIAIKTDTQLRRLQHNRVDSVLTIFGQQDSLVELAIIDEENSVAALSGPTSCWQFEIKQIDTEYFEPVDQEG